MTQTIDAIFEDGAFRPVRPEQVLATNGQRVTLIAQSIAAIDRDTHPDPLELAASVYDGLTSEEIDEIEQFARRTVRWNRGMIVLP